MNEAIVTIRLFPVDPVLRRNTWHVVRAVLTCNLLQRRGG